jgi:hypothetical protein
MLGFAFIGPVGDLTRTRQIAKGIGDVAPRTREKRRLAKKKRS